MSNRTAVKSDLGKLRYDLVPFEALDKIVEVLTYGKNKYPADGENWRVNSVPEDLDRYKAALLRHMSRIMQGEILDDESGLHHMAHIATNAMFIMALEEQFQKEEENNMSDIISQCYSSLSV